jgi:hypothetical protein
VKAFEEENKYDSCECTPGSVDSSATLTCSNSESCPRSCNLDNTVCWTESDVSTFDADGQRSLLSEIRTYIEGRDEVVAWEGRFNDTCSMTVNGVACNSCGYTTCGNSNVAPAVDCENIEVGASFDTCLGSIEGQTGVLQAFNDIGTDPCLFLIDPQAVCQEEADFYSFLGSTCDCAIDPVTGTSYILTCELSSCLSCNSENTVCALQGSSITITKYGQFHSSVVTYTYVSGGRDETVVLSGPDLTGGNDCSITVDDTPCNSCGPITCNITGNEFDGVAVDCENIETGATYDTCEGGGFVVDTGVLEVLSSGEFFDYCDQDG